MNYTLGECSHVVLEAGLTYIVGERYFGGLQLWKDWGNVTPRDDRVHSQEHARWWSTGLEECSTGREQSTMEGFQNVYTAGVLCYYGDP